MNRVKFIRLLLAFIVIVFPLSTEAKAPTAKDDKKAQKQAIKDEQKFLDKASERRTEWAAYGAFKLSFFGRKMKFEIRSEGIGMPATFQRIENGYAMYLGVYEGTNCYIAVEVNDLSSAAFSDQSFEQAIENIAIIKKAYKEELEKRELEDEMGY